MILSTLLVLLFSVFSFSSVLYWLLVQKLGVGIAYVIDQLFPLSIATSIAFIVFKKSKINIITFLNSHRWSLILLIVIAFFVHRWILGFYFFAEAPTSFLAAVTNNGDRLIQVFRGYHFGAYVLSYLLFSTNVWFYNLLTLLLYISLTIVLYIFIHTLLKSKLFAFAGTVFFIAVPSYLTIFIWQQDASGMFLVLLSGIFSLQLLLYYQKEKNNLIYIASLLFYVAMIKIGFGRAAGFIVLPLFLLFLPIHPFKIDLKKTILLSLPYIATFLLFLLLVFLIPDRVLYKIISGNASSITVRSDPLNFNNYFPALSTWIAYLFLPNQLAAKIYPLIKPVLQNASSFSITVVVGMISSITLLAISFISLFNLERKEARLILFAVVWIFCNIFFLPILIINDYHNFLTIDSSFTRIDPGSAPGSKYVFFSSVGLSILIAVFTLWIKKRSKRIFSVWIALLIILIVGYVTLSSNYYKEVLRETPQLRVIPDKVFSMVPKDGKKKILFSTNPIKNAIDNQTGTYGEKWLNSFYPYSELFYTNNRDTFEQLIREEKYKKENVYAFYNNPATLGFADVSQLVRSELFSANKSNNKSVSILNSQIDITSKILPSGLNDNNYPLILQRGIFVSSDLNYRFVFPKKIMLSIRKNDNTLSKLPYLDAIITDNNDQEDYFPLTLWNDAQNPPLISDKDGILDLLKLPSFDNKPIYAINLQDKLNIANILKERESIRLGAKVSVSDIYIYNTPEDKHVSKDSLSDGIITHDPLKDYERYFVAKTTPTKITLNLPFETVLGRVLLNTPPRNLDNLPTDVEVYSLKDERKLVGSFQTKTPTSTWSPNKGNLTDISLQPFETSSLQIDIKKTTKAPVILDEIILDSPSALAYSPEKIYELGNLSFHYVDDKTLLDKLLNIQKFNSLTVFYACAEDKDWSLQKKDFSEAMPNIWKVSDAPLTNVINNQELSFSVDCYGSLLRKIIVIGPPYPSNILLKDVALE